jgi:serine/threonine protein kinase
VAVEKSTAVAANELRKLGDLLTGEFKWIGKTILEILSRLEFIHQLHEIYRDLKPDNSLCHQHLRLTIVLYSHINQRFWRAINKTGVQRMDHLVGVIQGGY